MANRYAVAAGGNWTADATWSTTDGGAPDTVAPTASDDVFLTSNSGQVTISATSVGKSLNCTGYTGTLTHNAFNLTISGSITLVSGMTYTPVSGSTLTMNATGTLTTGGKLLWRFAQSGGAVVTLGDNLSFVAQKADNVRYTITSTSLNLNGFTLSGNSATNRVLITSNTLGTPSTITNTTGTFANADFRDITFSTAADYSAITGLSGDCGGNTNATFTTAATQTYTGGTGSWSDVTKWTSRVPLPQDNVLMSGVTGGTITADMPRLGKSIDWTGASGTPAWAMNIAHTIYGSVTHISAMTKSGTSSTTLEGRGSSTFTSAGVVHTNSMVVSMFGGTLDFQDAYTTSGTPQINWSNGTWNTNGFSVSVNDINTSNSNTRSINLGASTLTLGQSSGNAWTASTATGLTLNAGTSTIVLSNTGASSKTFAGGGLTYNNLSISGGGAGAVIITGANTFNRIYTNGGGTKSITLPGSTTTTIKSGQGLDNGTNLITFTASSGSATLANSTATILAWDYISITNIPASGTCVFYAGDNSTDGGGNTNWIFDTAPFPQTTFTYSINDLKQRWYSARGYSGTLNDNELKYFNDQTSRNFLSIRDAKERFFLNLGYTGTLNEMYYKALTNSMSLAQNSYSVTDAERVFYSNTANTFNG